MNDQKRLLVSVYATANVISPYIALVDPIGWPANSAARRMVRRGLRLMTRRATAAEQETHDESLRHQAIRFEGIAELLRYHRDHVSRECMGALLLAMRTPLNRSVLAKLTRRIATKRATKARRKARILANQR